MTIWCCTGHRPDKLGGYTPAVKTKTYQLALQEVAKLPDCGFMLTGMALGWDTAVAAACLELGVRYIAAVPCIDQPNRWPLADRQVYKHLLDHAAQVYFLAGGYSPGVMQERNRWLVNRASHVLALWDGVKRGGTWGCVAYALSKKRTIRNVWDLYL